VAVSQAAVRGAVIVVVEVELGRVAAVHRPTAAGAGLAID
jgi:hypothetical protein